MSVLLFISIEGLKEFLPNSAVIMNWSIALIGASFLSIISNNYYKPEKGRLIYLLLFPAWALLAISVYNGVRMADAFTSTSFINPKAVDIQAQLIVPGGLMNDYYGRQVDFFYMGAGVLVIWLIAVVIFWIFEKNTKPLNT